MSPVQKHFQSFLDGELAYHLFSKMTQPTPNTAYNPKLIVHPASSSRPFNPTDAWLPRRNWTPPITPCDPAYLNCSNACLPKQGRTGPPPNESGPYFVTTNADHVRSLYTKEKITKNMYIEMGAQREKERQVTPPQRGVIRGIGWKPINGGSDWEKFGDGVPAWTESNSTDGDSDSESDSDEDFWSEDPETREANPWRCSTSSLSTANSTTAGASLSSATYTACTKASVEDTFSRVFEAHEAREAEAKGVDTTSSSSSISTVVAGSLGPSRVATGTRRLRPRFSPTLETIVEEEEEVPDMWDNSTGRSFSASLLSDTPHRFDCQLRRSNAVRRPRYRYIPKLSTIYEVDEEGEEMGAGERLCFELNVFRAKLEGR